MEIVKAANLAVRFLLELCALAALGYWGFKSGNGLLLKLGLGLGAPLLAAVAWGLFVAPKAAVQLPGPARLLVELVIFGLALAALYAAGQPGLTWIFGIVYLINKLLTIVWRQ
jgi:hypothetical protein